MFPIFPRIRPCKKFQGLICCSYKNLKSRGRLAQGESLQIQQSGFDSARSQKICIVEKGFFLLVAIYAQLLFEILNKKDLVKYQTLHLLENKEIFTNPLSEREKRGLNKLVI